MGNWEARIQVIRLPITLQTARLPGLLASTVPWECGTGYFPSSAFEGKLKLRETDVRVAMALRRRDTGQVGLVPAHGGVESD